MTITYSIKNVTSELVKQIMIRKFFQMVFVGNDKKSLHIYTATVLGASDEDVEDSEDCNSNAAEAFISDFEKLNQFRMRFEFAVGNLDDNEVESICHEDLTVNDEYSFLNEVKCIQNVWGKKSDVIINDQGVLTEKYKYVFGEKGEEESKLIRDTANLVRQRVLFLEQKKNKSFDKCYKSLAISGEFENVNEPQVLNERDEIAIRHAYTISVPKSVKLPKGIEIVNWVRTTIKFRYSFDDKNLNYSIKKDLETNGKCYYYAPDFTWYFSPVVKSFIDTRNCFVELKRGIKGSVESCTCPIQKTKRTFYQNDKFQNSINPVPNKLTVNFHYWTEEEKIQLRQKYRLAVGDIFLRPSDFNETSEINIFLDMSDEHNRGNRQFLSGIFLSAAVAYGIDSSRIEDISKYFIPLNRLFPADILWIFFIGLFIATLMNKPVKLNLESRKLGVWRRINTYLSGIWMFFVFGICRAPWMESYVNQYDFFQWITGSFYCLIGLSHIMYLFNKNVRVRKQFLVNLFGEDIL